MTDTNCGVAQRSLDHFVISVKDIEIAAEMYRHLGFRVMPVMEHSAVGTSNVCIQFQDTYLELIGDSDHARDQQIKDFLKPWQDTSEYIYWQTSVTSEDLERDRPILQTKGLQTNEILNATRKVRKIGGGFDETASSSMYIPNQVDIRASVFISEHNKPEAIWMPGYTVHPNTVKRVRGISYIAQEPTIFAEYYASILGVNTVEQTASGFRIATPRGEFLDVVKEGSPDDILEGVAALEDGLPIRGAVFTYEIADIERCRLALRDGGVPHKLTERGELVVETVFGCGMASRFAEVGV